MRARCARSQQLHPACFRAPLSLKTPEDGERLSDLRSAFPENGKLIGKLLKILPVSGLAGSFGSRAVLIWP